MKDEHENVKTKVEEKNNLDQFVFNIKWTLENKEKNEKLQKDDASALDKTAGRRTSLSV